MALADDLLAVLDDPTHMWTHALKELSNDAQRLFLTLTMLPKPVSSDVLQIAYTAQIVNKSESFLDSLRSLEGSFVTIERRYANLRSVSFKNPSLEDFANAYVDANSDWLDVLLSAPKYFEQVAIAFSLAVAPRAVPSNGDSKLPREDSPRYPGIRSWVERRSGDLIGAAVDLLGAEKAEIYVDVRRSRIGQLLEIMAAYNVPAADDVAQKLRTATSAALQPSGEDAARVMVELLGKRAYREILDNLMGENAAIIMREHILDKDSWKFGVLAEIDRILRLDSEASWDSWGADYVEYARQLADSLADSDDDDELRVAIGELTMVSDMLGVYLGDEIGVLERRRSSLPWDDDFNENKLVSNPSDNAADQLAQLERVFGSLLQLATLEHKPSAQIRSFAVAAY